MSFLKVLEKSGIIQILRSQLKTEEDKQAFDEQFKEQVKYYSQVYEDLNAKVMEYKSDVEKLNVKKPEYRQPEGEDDTES